MKLAQKLQEIKDAQLESQKWTIRKQLMVRFLLLTCGVQISILISFMVN